MTDLDKQELDIAGKILAATLAAQMIAPARHSKAHWTTEDLAIDALEAAKILVANRRGS